MKNKFFKIPVSNTTAAEESLNSFCANHSITHLEKHFVADAENSFWAVAVTYTDQTDLTNSTKTKRAARVDYKEILSPDDFTTYAQLRDLRTTIAEREGVPTYAVFNNEQLSQIVLQKITTKTALQKIEGIGKSRVEKYGDEFIAIIKRETLTDNEA